MAASKTISYFRTILKDALSPAFMLVCGAIVSYVQADWTWFSRTGSLIVVYSIASLGMSYASHVQNDIRKQVIEILLGAARRLQNTEVSKLGDREQNTEEVTEPLTSTEWKQIKEIVVTDVDYIKQAHFHQFNGIITGVVGTLVWGWGDLLGKLF